METVIRHLCILKMIPRRGRIDATTIHRRLETDLPGYKVDLPRFSVICTTLRMPCCPWNLTAANHRGGNGAMTLN